MTCLVMSNMAETCWFSRNDILSKARNWNHNMNLKISPWPKCMKTWKESLQLVKMGMYLQVFQSAGVPVDRFQSYEHPVFMRRVPTCTRCSAPNASLWLISEVGYFDVTRGSLHLEYCIKKICLNYFIIYCHIYMLRCILFVITVLLHF